VPVIADAIQLEIPGVEGWGAIQVEITPEP